VIGAPAWRAAVEGERYPELRAGPEQVEAARHDADHPVSLAVDVDNPSRNRRISAECAQPETVRQQGDPFGAGPILRFRVEAADLGVDVASCFMMIGARLSLTAELACDARASARMGPAI
jgi:hypothetical protein